jgi:hypothetical protein
MIQSSSQHIKRELMNVLKRLIPFIILNILISAATTWAVLNWWTTNRMPVSPAPSLEFIPSTPTTGTSSAVSNTTALPPGVKVIEFSEASGAGSLANEMVGLRRVGEGELRMSGWRLEDGSGHRYTFPDMVLNKGGSVRIFTRAGSNTVNELYWGLKESVWVSGKTAGLYDDQANLRATFTIP